MKKKPNRITNQQLDQLRDRAQRDANFRAQLMGGRKSSTKAIARILGPNIALRYRVYVGPKVTSEASVPVDTTSEAGARTIVPTIDLSVITLHINVPTQPNGIPYQGEAASAFCLAEDTGQDGSWACIDEEVEISQSGQIRGRGSRAGN